MHDQKYWVLIIEFNYYIKEEEEDVLWEMICI
jgi:hypothetical protein